jgi:hypothetical protein
MSSIPLYTGGGTDDPATVSQFRQARTYGSGGGGITEITSNTTTLQVIDATGPTVTLQYNGVDTVAAGPGISVTPAGNTTTVNNTGVRSLASTTGDIVVANGGVDPVGTGDITLTFNGPSATLAPAEAFSIIMINNSAALISPEDPGQPGVGTWEAFQKRPAQSQLWDTTINNDFSPQVGSSVAFDELRFGSLDLVNTGRFTSGLAAIYCFHFSTVAVGNDDTLYALALVKNGTQALISMDAAHDFWGSRTVFLDVGEYVELRYFNDEVELGSGAFVVHNHPNIDLPNSRAARPQVPIIFSGVQVTMTQAATQSSAAPERFAVTLNADFDSGTSDDAWVAVTDLTQVLDTVTFSDYYPDAIFNNLTVGTLDLAAGKFTVGVTGHYILAATVTRPRGDTSDTLVGYRVNGTKILRCCAQEDGIPFISFQYFTAGDEIELVMWNKAGIVSRAKSDDVSSVNIPHIIWSGYLVRGGGSGGSGAVQPESFSASLSADFNTASSNTWIPLAPTTTTVNTIAAPSTDPSYLYSDLTLGSYDGVTSTFTVGVTGQYMFSWTPYLPGANVDPQVRIDGSKYLAGITSGDGRQTAVASLTAGQTVQLVVYDNNTGTEPYLTTLADSTAVYSVNWFGHLIGGSSGGGGGGGSTSSESFAVAMANDFNTSNTGTNVTLTDFTDTVNVIGTPDIDPATLFDNLTTGTINLATGEFTVGVTGTYNVFWPNYAAGFVVSLRVNNVKQIQPMFTSESVQNSALVNLTSGDVLSLTIFDNTVDTILAISTTNSGADAYTVLWGAALIAPGSGGGGGGSGVVETIVAGAGIGVDSTDPANPIVTNNGVRSVSSSHAYLTVDNTDPRNPVLANNGVLTVSTTGGSSGLAITGTANNPILRNTGIRSITSGTPATLSVLNNSGAVTLSVTGGGGGGGGSGTVVGVTPAAASGAEVPNVGLTITNPTSNVQIQNNAVLRVTGGSGINITGDQRNRTLSVGQIGSGSNYTVFDPATGFQTMSGTARPWKTETIPMIYISTTDPTQAPGGNEIYTGARSWFPSFRNAANINSLTGFWAVPYELAWQQIGVGQYSTLTYFGINWMPNTTAAGNVRWRLRWKYLRGGDVLSVGSPFTTDGVTQAAGGVAGSLRWTGFFAVNQVLSGLPNTGQGDIIAVSVQRDPDDPLDTYPDQALFCGLRCIYQVDQHGGRQNTAR